MKKSVYSLVLMDDVIKAVDEQAYRLGTSRSNLINQILAERLSCVTPEMRMRDIFDSLSGLISSSFQIQQQRSASLMTLRTALEYKYRPTLSYKIGLERQPGDYLGELRITIRTQNERLLAMFHSFFAWLAQAERRFIGDDKYSAQLTPACFTRKLINTGASDEETGEAISAYLTWINSMIQRYFTSPEDFPAAYVEKSLREELAKYPI